MLSLVVVVGGMLEPAVLHNPLGQVTPTSWHFRLQHMLPERRILPQKLPHICEEAGGQGH